MSKEPEDPAQNESEEEQTKPGSGKCRGGDICGIDTISGGNDEGVPPVPIPNTEVKPLGAESTWLETAREDRTLPDSNREVRKSFSFFCIEKSPGARGLCFCFLSCFSGRDRNLTFRHVRLFNRCKAHIQIDLMKISDSREKQ